MALTLLFGGEREKDGLRAVDTGAVDDVEDSHGSSICRQPVSAEAGAFAGRASVDAPGEADEATAEYAASGARGNDLRTGLPPNARQLGPV